MLYVVRAVDTFDIGLLQAKHLTNDDQWKGQSVIQSLYIFPDKSSRVLTLKTPN